MEKLKSIFRKDDDALTKFAKDELDRFELVRDEKLFPTESADKVRKLVLKLCACFNDDKLNQKEKDVAFNFFLNLAQFKILTPVTDEAENWELAKDEKGKDLDYFRHKYLKGLFKDVSTKKAYYMQAVKFRDEKGNLFFGSAQTSKGKVITSHQFVKFPFYPKTFILDVQERDFSKRLTEETDGKSKKYFIIPDFKQVQTIFSHYVVK